MNHSLVMLTGGVDSTTALWKMLNVRSALQGSEKSVDCLVIDYGSKHAGRDVQVATDIYQAAYKEYDSILRTLHVIRIPNVFKLYGGQTVHPGRNLVLIGIATTIAEQLGCTSITFANHATDAPDFPDCTPDFMQPLREAIHVATKGKILLINPFEHKTKGMIVQLGDRLKVPFELTWSCYEDNYPTPCGKCPTCIERRKAFEWAGVTDPRR